MIVKLLALLATFIASFIITHVIFDVMDNHIQPIEYFMRASAGITILIAAAFIWFRK